MTAGAACGSCGTGLRENAKFCDECGAAARASADTAQYKQVTVLFADVVRSMDIAAVVDIERLREIMTELAERLAAVVRRYGGIAEFNGDGVMALFGAPVALEDHAFRGCLAALAIQQEASGLAAEVHRLDGVTVKLRVGLNSGRVIAGEIGSLSLGYTAIGHAVGFAQRMESVAPPGGVLLSESTAQLVEHTATLAEPEWVRIKGADEPVRARRLLAICPRDGVLRRAEACLVGRRWEMAALGTLVDRTIGGCGGVVHVVGPPGIGKSRVAREASALATARGVEVVWGFCESHTRDVPFHAMAGLLRARTRVADLDGEAARARVLEHIPETDPDDLAMLYDLLGIADADVTLPTIDADARRRRLTALINTTALARTRPLLYIIEDAHWIDEASESMFADFLSFIPRTPSMVLITSRPEYGGALARIAGGQTVALDPLGDSETTALLTEMLGVDSSVDNVSAAIAERAAGNPFFAQEMVRELIQRGVLAGKRGSYRCRDDVADLTVPATVQAAIAARIDRLDAAARRTLNAASVMGARFDAELLTVLGVDAVFEELLVAELIDQVGSSSRSEFAFHHPLIRAVAYESQLKSDRAESHRRLAAAIEERGSSDEKAALIAQHLEAAGELRPAYRWHMRAATWATSRDIAAARLSWGRAEKIADALPAEDSERAAMRIAPRTMLCGTAYRVRGNAASARFIELRALATAAGDKTSLAIGMAGLVMNHAYQGRIRESSQLASEAITLIESIGQPTLTVGLSFPAIYAQMESGEYSDVLRWSQRVIDLADGDPSRGDFIFGSPLALALTSRATARYWLGCRGWRDDLHNGMVMASSADPLTYAAVVAWGYFAGIPNCVLGVDDRALHEIEYALRIAERSGNDMALAFAWLTLGVALVHRQTATERNRGQALLAEVSDVFVRRGHNLGDRPLVEVYLARERARGGDRDGAIPLIVAAVDQLVGEGQLLSWGTPATAVLVETLLDRGAEGDVAQAEVAVERLAATPADDGLVMREVWLSRLRALLARARGDQAGYCQHRDRYHIMAKSYGFEGHSRMAEDMR